VTSYGAGRRGADAGHLPIGYRSDIDGLRAIAVGAVVLYHAGLPGMPGGFTGVDIFFVISGYLIGGQIFREALAGTFRFAGFYTRRVRRILPALFFLLGVLYLAGLVLLSPQELRELGKEAVPTVFGLSNLLFYTGGGYFGPASDAQPLLMTWSLGVEEQFYLVLPFVMLAMVKIRRESVLSMLIAGSLLSFVASLLLLPLDPKAAFYLLPPRAWELGIGAALAVWEDRRGGAGLPTRLGQIVAPAGLCLLMAGILLYNHEIAFPGWFALLPTLGTAILIATNGSLVNRSLLSLAPMRFIGQISYSWYLWHWPLFYLNRTLSGVSEGQAGVLPTAWILALSLSCAFLSWWLVEQSLRRRVLGERAALMRYGIVGTSVAGLALALFLSDGVPGRMPDQARLFTAQAMAARADACLAPYGATTPVNVGRCVSTTVEGRARLVVLGDSHAASLAPGLADLARRAQLNFGEMTKSSCLPVNGFGTEQAQRPNHARECTDYQKAAFDRVLLDPDTKVVVLAGFWSSVPQLWRASDGGQSSVGVALEAAVASLVRAGKRVVIVQDTPRFAFDPYARVVGDFLPLRRQLRAAEQPDAYGAPALPDSARIAIIDIARRYPGVQLIDPYASLCRGSNCAYRDDNAIYYFDSQHLTAPGAKAALKHIAPGLFQDRL
jgi:peptidoglycan/LPS O-acetylase OafA/YrhL